MEAQRKLLASPVRCAIIMRSNDVHTSKVDKKTAAKLLQEDILNSALHCFGSHHKCKPDYCKMVRAMKDGALTNNVTLIDKDKHSLPDLRSPDASIEDTFSISSSTPSTSFNDSTNSSSSLISISVTDSPDDSISGRDDSLASTASTKISTETDEETMHTVLQEQQTAW